MSREGCGSRRIEESNRGSREGKTWRSREGSKEKKYG